MKVSEKGVKPESNVYFHTPGEESLRLFLYPICCGHFFCDGNYLVERDNYDSFLLFFVIRGEGFAESGGHRTALSENDAVLLDCYRNHRYGTESGWEILWTHFDGVMARGYFESAAPRLGCTALTPRDPHNIRSPLRKIYDQFHETGAVNDTLNNKYIMDMLTEFMLRRGPVADGSRTVIPEDLLAYIAENIARPLTLDELAGRASLSRYYFSRLFKHETGYTPHKYVLAARINAAKFYLKSSRLSIKEISASCGFANEGVFCTAFKRIVGITPMAYRNRMMTNL
ncbi:MAG: AraC family transcriptional regulator [Synergistaceae bacterium]|jgi:AraC-like DNA-binding protein|nr:AraC family transcriptional regulator [Synergistaceae bacterium]